MLQFFLDLLCHDVCGWIGSQFMKIVSPGHLDLDSGDGSSESVLAEGIGLIVLAATCLPPLF